MNKSALRTFAIRARKELLKKVKAKAMQIGITEDNIKKADIESSDAIFIDGRQLSKEEKIQRDKLITHINQNGFKQVMEEVAYIWFNRFTALRFMEVNDYLPTGVRVLSSSNPNSADPDVLNEALELDLELDKEYIYELKLNNKTEELFKYLIIKHCNDLNRYLPFMFEKIDDFTEILFPEGLLAKDSFIRQMTNPVIISENDWEEVEIIGWLYQYYNTELNELVYDGNMSKSRIPKELLPAATQLFTPDWAVKYMVENSIGKLWLEGKSDTKLKEIWKYYLENVEDSNSEPIKYSQINPEEIKILDPCMGSGHILVYAFDVLMNIYESCGYMPREATKLILQKNLYGLEIEDRAYQLACFSLIMKARKYNKRIFDENIELNLCSIIESNEICHVNIKDIINLDDKDIKTTNYIIDVFKDAKEYGSILNIEIMDYDSLLRSLIDTENQDIRDLFQGQLLTELREIIPKLIKQAKIMTQTYDVVITNPPYLGSSRMSPLLNEYVKNNFQDTKSDLSMVMYQKAIESYSKLNGFISFITTTSWMFVKSFEKFRVNILEKVQFSSLVDFGTELFEGKVGHNPIVSWVNKNSTPRKKVVAIRLTDFNYSKRDQKESEYFNLDNRYYPNQQNFRNIPGSPVAYWVNENFTKPFSGKLFKDYSEVITGMTTGNNEKYLKLWHEVSFKKISLNRSDMNEVNLEKTYWIPYNKGGVRRNWYGNNEYVVNWSKKAEFNRSKTTLQHLYLKEGITWPFITSGKFSARYFGSGFLWDVAGSPCFFKEKETLYYALGYLCSKLADYTLNIINPTINIQAIDIEKLPFILDKEKMPIINELVKENICISKNDWDSIETSWDFSIHPLIKFNSVEGTIKDSFEEWKNFANKQFTKLKENEEELNSIFIKIYDFQDNLTPNVNDKEVTVRMADLERDIKSFISYAIGCIFGRYSLDEEGIVHAGGEFESTQYITFKPDEDNILPILPGAYFEDDIVSKFIDFVKVAVGEKKLAENLDYIADTLGKKKGETAKETIRRYFLNDFFKDHVKTYQKRPIYWLFTSGKQKAFNCLIYMHRYDKTTLSRIRTDYLHEYQIRLDAEQKELLSIIEGDYTTKEISNAKKELKTLDKKIEELKEYDELLHHMADMQIEIDLDNGVKVNYEKFKGLVTKL